MSKASRFKTISVGIVVVLNFVYLIPACLLPAGNGEVHLLKSMTNQLDQKGHSTVYVDNKVNPMDPLGGRPLAFYLPSHLQVKELKSEQMISSLALSENDLLFISYKDLDNYTDKWEIVDYSIPVYLQPFRKFYRGRKFILYVLLKPRITEY